MGVEAVGNAVEYVPAAQLTNLKGVGQLSVLYVTGKRINRIAYAVSTVCGGLYGEFLVYQGL